MITTRISWDTSIKHLVRHGLLHDILTTEQIALIPNSNISRWKNEADDKYVHSELNNIIKKEVALIKRLNQSSRIKKINESYFMLLDGFHTLISNIKGIHQIIKEQKDIVVNAIESVKSIISINKALKVFNISRATFQNYKALVIHKCDNSYFNWCTKRFPNQLLVSEVTMIKKYMTDTRYKFWSKSSVYIKAIRNENLHCGITTFYKYCNLLGFVNSSKKRKSDNYKPVRTTMPNELWCADVTIYRTLDGVKHYIHFLMDHYSKMILGYSIEKSSNGKAIRNLLQYAYLQYKPEKLNLLTDAGSENVNKSVSSYLNSLVVPIKHIIAQKDVVFSNSMIEALNKVIKHQFLHPKNIVNGTQLVKELDIAVLEYNTDRHQWSLGGNTPFETYNDTKISFSQYTKSFSTQKAYRITQNQHNKCAICL